MRLLCQADETFHATHNEYLIVEQNMAGISAVRLVMFYHHLGIKKRATEQLLEMTSSAKAEVHNVLQRRQRRTKPRQQATCTKDGEI